MKDKELDIAYFISFCIEQYKVHISATGSEVMNIFRPIRSDRVPISHYDVLHTQSRQWLLEEIDDFIQQRKQEKQK